tara:strand:- start:6263 stop:8488 length:2226 start_codon:yes stop_codon:yes gene_type:complete
MSSFLKKINEYKAPVMAPKSEDDSAAMAGMKTGFDKPKQAVASAGRKVTGVMGRVASGLGKVKKAADMIKTVGTGEWSIDNLLDGMIKKARDQQSGKITLFGQPGHNLVMLGKGYIESIKSMQGKEPDEIVDDTEAVDVEKSVEKGDVETKKEGDVETKKEGDVETKKESFLDKVDNLLFEVTKAEGDKIRAKAEELGIPIKTKSGKPIGPARLQGRIDRKLAELKADEKQRKLDLTDDDKAVNKATDAKESEKETKEDTKEKTKEDAKEETKEDTKKSTGDKTFKPIGDTVSAKARLTPLVADVLGVKDEELVRYTNYISKNFGAVLTAIQKAYGPDSEYAKKEDSKPLDFTFELKGFGRISDKEQEDLKKKQETKEVKESTILKLIEESVATDIADKAGRDGAEKLVKGMEAIYPGKQITFKTPEPDPKPEPEPEDEPEVEQDILTTATKFSLVNGKDYGEERQYTLKPQEDKVGEYLTAKGIKFITYVQKPKPRALTGGKGGQIGSNFELSKSSQGRLIAYDDENQVISQLNVDAPYEWNSTEKAYSLSRNNTVKIGPDPAKGEMGFATDAEEIYFSDPNRKYITLVKDRKQADESLKNANYPGNKILLGGDLRAEFDQKLFKKYAIVRTDEEGNFIVNVRQPLPLAPADVLEMQKRNRALAGPSAGKTATGGTGKTETTTTTTTTTTPGVKKDVKQGQGVLIDPTTGKPITGERVPKDQNEEEKVVSKYLEKIEEYL